jgi:hypothetical protein
LMIAPSGEQRSEPCVAFFHHNVSQSRKAQNSRHSHLRSIHRDALCRLFFFAMSGHAGPIQMDLGVAPVV